MLAKDFITFVRTKEYYEYYGVVLDYEYKIYPPCTAGILPDGRKTPSLRKVHIDVMYRNMMLRCYHKNFSSFYAYGERGISVCKEWAEDKTNFFKWAVTNGYKPWLELDRINNELGYFPENCRFLNKSANNLNKRASNISGEIGIYQIPGSLASPFQANFKWRRRPYMLGKFKKLKDAAGFRDILRRFIVDTYGHLPENEMSNIDFDNLICNYKKCKYLYLNLFGE